MTSSSKKKPNFKSDRVKALQIYESLEKGIDRDLIFDKLASLAAEICHVSKVYIKLISDDAQYVKAAYGAERDEKPGKLGICQHTVEQDGILEITDSEEHELFKKYPELKASGSLRFYAGVPLKTPDGYNIGTLCLVDEKPGRLTGSQKDALMTLADEIMSRYELNRIRNELAKKIEEKDELIKIVSHDIRNPLAGIINFSKLLQEELTNQDHLDMVNNIENGGETILSIINMMLDSDEVRNKAFIVRNTETDVVRSVNKMIDLYRKSIERKGQKLVQIMPDSLIVLIDKDKWEQIVGNLLSNAIRYTDKGGTITIQLETSFKIKNLLDLTISDTGIGIPDKIMDSLFTGKKSILRKCTEGKKSSGFGIFITQKYVKLMKGMINVSSGVGTGTEVKVRIPI